MKKKINTDPRAIIISQVFITLTAVLVPDLIVMTAVLGCVCLLVFLLGINPLRIFLKLKRFLIIFISLIFLQSIFNRSGIVLVSIGNVALLTSGGLTGGLVVFLRLGILLMSGAAVASFGVRRGIQALIQLKIPYEIAFMVCIAIYFIPLLSGEMRDALTAIQLRGIDFKRISFRRRVRVYTYLFLPVVGSAVLKAQDIAAGIELRGFRAYPTRTSLIILRMRLSDYLLVLTFALGAFILIWN